MAPAQTPWKTGTILSVTSKKSFSYPTCPRCRKKLTHSLHPPSPPKHSSPSKRRRTPFSDVSNGRNCLRDDEEDERSGGVGRTMYKCEGCWWTVEEVEGVWGNVEWRFCVGFLVSVEGRVARSTHLKSILKTRALESIPPHTSKPTVQTTYTALQIVETRRILSHLDRVCVNLVVRFRAASSGGKRDGVRDLVAGMAKLCIGGKGEEMVTSEMIFPFGVSETVAKGLEREEVIERIIDEEPKVKGENPPLAPSLTPRGIRFSALYASTPSSKMSTPESLHAQDLTFQEFFNIPDASFTQIRETAHTDPPFSQPTLTQRATHTQHTIESLFENLSISPLPLSATPGTLSSSPTKRRIGNIDSDGDDDPFNFTASGTPRRLFGSPLVRCTPVKPPSSASSSVSRVGSSIGSWESPLREVSKNGGSRLNSARGLEEESLTQQTHRQSSSKRPPMLTPKARQRSILMTSSPPRTPQSNPVILAASTPVLDSCSPFWETPQLIVPETPLHGRNLFGNDDADEYVPDTQPNLGTETLVMVEEAIWGGWVGVGEREGNESEDDEIERMLGELRLHGDAD
ncbi:hypothetical protein HDU67_006408 [Dinochytrium kinnereticum]|nr:hypothetical protein HDU67_006408 [Dinochytrium kinnereticum]